MASSKVKVYLDKDASYDYIFSNSEGYVDRWTLDISSKEYKKWDKIVKDYFDLQDKIELMLYKNKGG